MEPFRCFSFWLRLVCIRHSCNALRQEKMLTCSSWCAFQPQHLRSDFFSIKITILQIHIIIINVVDTVIYVDRTTVLSDRMSFISTSRESSKYNNKYINRITIWVDGLRFSPKGMERFARSRASSLQKYIFFIKSKNLYNKFYSFPFFIQVKQQTPEEYK